MNAYLKKSSMILLALLALTFSALGVIPVSAALPSQLRYNFPLYAANFNNNQIVKLDSSGNQTVLTSGGNISNSFSAAVDSSGNLYVGDISGKIVKVTPSGTQSVFTTITTGGNIAYGLAFDTSGNLYVADLSRVIKVTPGGTQSVFASGGYLSNPVGLAFDTSGNLFVANYQDATNSVVKISTGGAQSLFTGGGNLTNPFALAFDASGNLYVTNFNESTLVSSIIKVTPGGTQSVFASGGSLNAPRGLAFDINGNLYAGNYTDTGNNSVVKLDTSGNQSVFAYSGNLYSPVGLAFGGGFQTAATNAATSITSSGATLNGTVNPANYSTTVTFEYGLTTSYGSTVTADQSPVNGSTDTAVSKAITGLTPNTLYHFRVATVNTSGPANGLDQTFTTGAIAPTVTTNAATSVTSSSATLNGSANPSGATTTGWFRYATTDPGTCNDTFGTRAPATGGSSLGSGASPVAYSQGISGLTPGTTYYYCAIAQNSVGTSFGSMVSFLTLSAPTVTTNAATSVTSSSATLNGSANPGGASTTGWFRYSTTNPGTCNDTFGTRAPATGGSSLGSGTSAVAYSQGISGLTPGATYYYCAIAQNSVGFGYGSVVSFTTSVIAPIVTTNAATSITSSGATLNGSANPGGATTTGWFRYSTTDPGTCNDTFGTRAPASGGSSLGSGASAVAYSQGISGLTPGTTYYYCAIAQNSVGTSFGSMMSFLTLSAPTVTTNAATSVTSSSATLNGSANPGGATTTGWFRYSTTDPGTCTDTFGTRAPATGGSSLGSGASAVAYSQGISGLTPGATYYYCAIAQNSVGFGYGSVASFTTSAIAPTATTNAATSVTSTGATLNGSANPGGAITTGWFRYSTTNPGTCNDTFGTRAPVSGGSSLGSGNSSVPYSLGISGLTPGATYYYCAIAQNSVGTAFGSVVSFTTPAPPTVTTTAASSITSSGATLNGMVNANNQSTNVTFEYGLTTGYGSTVTADQSPVSGTSNTAVSKAITGLTPNTLYHFRVHAVNATGPTDGLDQTFTTSTVAPTATTNAASSLTSTGAMLNGTVNANNANTMVTFEYGTDTSYGTTVTAVQSPVSGTADTAVSKAIIGLTPNTLYHFRVDAINTAGTTYGLDQTFTTNALASTTTTVTSSLNPSRFGQTVTFTATVTSGAGTPAGTVTFMDGATSLGATVMIGGVATLSTAMLATGSHAITASYSGDTNFSASTGTLAGGQTVNASNVVVFLASPSSPITVGQTATFTATVSIGGVYLPLRESPITCVLSGTVTFYEDASALGSASVDDNCQAVFSTATLAVGTHNVTAQYSGNANYGSGTSNIVTLIVNANGTTTTLASSLNPSSLGQSVTFTATVSPTPDGGTVIFKDSGTIIIGCEAKSLTGGQATCSTSALTVGSHVITVEYSGTTNYAASTGTLSPDQQVTAPTVSLSASSHDFGNQLVGTTSGAFTITVTNTGTTGLHLGTLGISGEFALSNNTCNSATVTPGNTCTFAVTFSPLSFGPKTGSVSIPSDAATSPDSVILSGSGYTTSAMSFVSIAAQDGYVTENKTTDMGGSAMARNKYIQIGDSGGDRQMKGFLSFDTSTLPAGAVIVGAHIEMYYLGLRGNDNPFDWSGPLHVDIATPFGTSELLERSDFETTAPATDVAACNAAPEASNWYTCDVFAGAGSFNRSGFTQFRLYFAVSDNGDKKADYVLFASANNRTAAYYPVLVVEYYVP